MAEPFSTIAGAIGVADVCLRAGKYLQSVQKAAKHVDDEIDVLQREITQFKSVYTALTKLCATSAAESQSADHAPPGLNDPCGALWSRAGDLVQEGHELVKKLQALLQTILGEESLPRFERIEDFRKAIKMLSKNTEYEKIRKRFTCLNLELTTMLTAIDLTSNALFRSKTYATLEQLPGEITQKLQELGLQLRSQIEKLESAKSDQRLEPSILSARAAITFATLNKHFYIQKSDMEIWTGRSQYLHELRDAILNPHSIIRRTQKRYVVQGIAGAGKTQFCCKFAQDYRESFWGIFWVDASSSQNAAESWKSIAKVGGRDANEEAGKHWLSNLQSPWLLIIDSADTSEEAIRHQFPSGDRGCILITTRNPRLKSNATAGHLSLDKLEEDEADDLLHKATKYEPWNVSAKRYAREIAEHLGFLPLALIHAGRAICHQFCTLQGYIPWFNRTLDEFRIKRPSIFLGEEDEEDDYGMGPFMSFDIIYTGLEERTRREPSRAVVSKDAVELINVYAFFHSTDIRLDILMKAGRNIQTTSRPSPTEGDTEDEPQSPSMPYLQRLKTWAIALAVRLQQQDPVMPNMFLNLKSEAFDERRARRAMDLLVRLSLVSESSERGTYSMHPLVHMWVRKRLSTSTQALWCEAAANVLASSIKVPPLVDEQGDQDYYLHIVSHVIQNQSFSRQVKKQLLHNRSQQGVLRSLIPLGKPVAMTVPEAYNAAKYSRVYMEGGKFEEAAELQGMVLDYAIARAGLQHPICIRLQLGLSITMWHLARAAEAQELQETALRSCRLTLGDTNSQTLKVMDALGQSYWQRGWLKEAKAIHEDVIRGMAGRPKLLRDRLNAMCHLGNVQFWYYDFKAAGDTHQEACEGLAAAYGDDDHDTLMATQCFAMDLMHQGGMDNLRRAYSLMQGVYARRRTKLGPEHVYTLWAACELGRTTASRGALAHDPQLIEEAKTIYHDGLEIARRNLGLDHVGTLMGRSSLADTLVIEQKYDEAETEYKDIAERQKHVPGARAGSHRDRLWTLQQLGKCYEEQGRLKDALTTFQTVLREMDAMGAQQHPWRSRMVRNEEDIVARLGQSADGAST